MERLPQHHLVGEGAPAGPAPGPVQAALVGEDLDGDVLLGGVVASQVDGAVAALPEHGEQGVAELELEHGLDGEHKL